MRWLHLTVRIFLCAVLTACLSFVALYAYGIVQMRRAERLVAAVSTLPIGEPLRQDSAFYSAELYCGPVGLCYREVGVSSLPLAFLWPRYPATVPRIIPVNWWGVTAQIGSDRNGRVLEKALFVDDGNYRQYYTVQISVIAYTKAFDPCYFPSQFRHPGYRPRREMRSGALLVDVAPDAARQFADRAFHLVLTCLRTRGGCRTPGDIAPDAWHDQAEDVAMFQQDMEQSRKMWDACSMTVLR